MWIDEMAGAVGGSEYVSEPVTPVVDSGHCSAL